MSKEKEYFDNKIYKTRELPLGSKVVIGDKEYEFRGMDGMYGRFRDLSTGRIGNCYGDFKKNIDTGVFIIADK